MHTVLTWIRAYGDVGVFCLVFLQMIMVIVAIRMVRRVKKDMAGIKDKVLDYLSVVMDEEEEEETQAQEHIISLQERQMKESLERKQKKQQEEIFNAVLQEIFP